MPNCPSPISCTSSFLLLLLHHLLCSSEWLSSSSFPESCASGVWPCGCLCKSGGGGSEFNEHKGTVSIFWHINILLKNGPAILNWLLNKGKLHRDCITTVVWFSTRQLLEPWIDLGKIVANDWSLEVCWETKHPEDLFTSLFGVQFVRLLYFCYYTA